MKLSFHVQYPNKAEWLRKIMGEYTRDHEPAIIKQLFYDDDVASRWAPHAVVARLYRKGGEEAQWIAQGAKGAEAYWESIKNQVRGIKKWIYAIEGPNEPYVGSTSSRLNLVAFTLRMVEIMRQETDRPYIVGNFSNQNPDVTNDAAIMQLAPLFEAAPILGLHQYGRPELRSEDIWAILRHRSLFAILRHKGVRVPPVMLTETGWDGTGTRYGQTGWKGLCPDFRKAIEQLRWFNDELERDPEVMAAFLFNSGGDDRWKGFEFGKGEVNDIIRAFDGVCPIPSAVPVPDLAVLPLLQQAMREISGLLHVYEIQDRDQIVPRQQSLAATLTQLLPRL